MAQLFQPTNITPDTRGSFGNGVVLIDPEATLWQDVMDVAWQVNGNTPMTAFQIDVTDMDGAGLYSTGKLTAGCPFYGTASDGSLRRFSYRIVQPDISTSFLREASEGLVRITQWWGSSDSDLVVQASPSPYLVRNALIASWSADGELPVAGRSAGFTGSFTGAEEDGLMWIRWVLESVTYERGHITSRQTVKDTGRMYGCVEPTFSFDRFLPGDYWLTLTGETSAGVLSESDGDVLHVSYEMEETGVAVEACKAPGGESAVLVRWARPMNIPRISVAGEATDTGSGSILFYNDSEMYWNEVNGSAMDFSSPWSFVWSGKITESGDGPLFALDMEDGRTVEAGLFRSDNWAEKHLFYRIVQDGEVLHEEKFYGNYTGGPCFFCVTPENVFVQYRRNDVTPGLYPAESLAPGEHLYPADDVTHATDTVFLTADSGLEQTALAGVHLYGPLGEGLYPAENLYPAEDLYPWSMETGTELIYAEVVDHAITDSTGEDPVSNYMGEDPDLSFNPGTLFLLRSLSGQDWNAGNILYDSAMTGLALYRRKSGENALALVGSVDGRDAAGMLDYGARSQDGPYIYYLYPLTPDKVESTPSVSGEVNPCFWNWTVLSCVRNENGEYVVEKSFLFGLNLDSGAISNSNRPNIMQNFTPYPTVQLSTQNYKAGTLQSLIGAVDHSGGQAEYRDTTELMEDIWELSVTTNYLFLKDRKGSLRMIRPSGEITMATTDETRAQAQTASFPWVEVADAGEAHIWGAVN